MRVSEVTVSLVKPHDGLVGFAALVIDDGIYLGGIAIHRKLDGSGFRLLYPTRKSGSQSFNIFHPINRDAGKVIEQAILAKLNDVMNRLDGDAGYNRADTA